MPSRATAVTAAASHELLPRRVAIRSAIELLLCSRATRTRRSSTPMPNGIQHDGADEGRRQGPARTCGLGDRAVEGPRGAVDRERERVDRAPVPRQQLWPTLAPKRGAEQEAEPEQAGQHDDGGAQHRRVPPFAIPVSRSRARPRRRPCRRRHVAAVPCGCRSPARNSPTSPSMLSDSTAGKSHASEDTGRPPNAGRPND
jgi:hypothetical protein